jgi:transposase
VGSPKERGRLSNPVQRRLSEAIVDDLVSAYLEGSSIDSLATQFGVNRTTIITHLDRRGIQRRKVVRKLTDRIVQRAATRYRKGESLQVVAAQFDVDARTLSKEFRRAGVPIRPRRGWPPVHSERTEPPEVTPVSSIAAPLTTGR